MILDFANLQNQSSDSLRNSNEFSVMRKLSLFTEVNDSGFCEFTKSIFRFFTKFSESWSQSRRRVRDQMKNIKVQQEIKHNQGAVGCEMENKNIQVWVLRWLLIVQKTTKRNYFMIVLLFLKISCSELFYGCPDWSDWTSLTRPQDCTSSGTC